MNVPSGFGPNNFIQPDGSFAYAVNFENEATATAPAQTVTVTEQLDPNLDWSTFQLGDIGFGAFVVSVPAGRTSFSTRVDATAIPGVFVDVTANFNVKTGLVTWTLTALDPTTLDLPMNPLVGLLPPNDKAPQGQGFVNYTVNLKAGLTSGTKIGAQATVVFDTNAPIQTAPQLNTIDAGPPTSSVNPLPATETSSTFNVTWSGQDDTGGSGIKSYDIYVSDNGGAFSPLLLATTQTSTTFSGQTGHTYGFYSVATDNVGNQQPMPTAAQATTTVTTGGGTKPGNQPKASITDKAGYASVVEPALGTSAPYYFTIALDGVYSKAVTVYYQTRDGTAKAGEDYRGVNNYRVTFPAFAHGATAQTPASMEIAITINGDVADGTDPETFSVVLTSAYNAVIDVAGKTATGTIIQATPEAGTKVSIADFSAAGPSAGRTVIDVPITLTNVPSNQPIFVYYKTTDQSASAGVDYLGINYGHIVIAPGDTMATIPITVFADPADQATKTFTLSLLGANGASLGNSTATISIVTN